MNELKMLSVSVFGIIADFNAVKFWPDRWRIIIRKLKIERKKNTMGKILLESRLGLFAPVTRFWKVLNTNILKKLKYYYIYYVKCLSMFGKVFPIIFSDFFLVSVNRYLSFAMCFFAICRLCELRTSPSWIIWRLASPLCWVPHWRRMETTTGVTQSWSRSLDLERSINDTPIIRILNTWKSHNRSARQMWKNFRPSAWNRCLNSK